MAKASRKNMRKSRKGSRKMNRKGSRKMKRNVRFHGGGQLVAPAGVNDTSMAASSRLSLAQGADYTVLHQGQHGGFVAPVGDTGMLDAGLRDIARVGVLDQSVAAIKGMQDGGGKKNRKRMLALLKKLSRKQRGGMPYALTQAQDYSSPGMLLSPSAERAALGSMNPEWRLAADPTSFAPNMRGGTIQRAALAAAARQRAARAALAPVSSPPLAQMSTPLAQMSTPLAQMSTPLEQMSTPPTQGGRRKVRSTRRR